VDLAADLACQERGRAAALFAASLESPAARQPAWRRGAGVPLSGGESRCVSSLVDPDKALTLPGSTGRPLLKPDLR